MRNLDCLIILNHTSSEQDAEVKEGLRALEARNAPKAKKVIVIEFSGVSDEPKLDVADVPKGGRIGIYVIGHAWNRIFSKGSDFQISATDLAAFIAKLEKSFDGPDLAKICLVGCGVAGGAVDSAKVTSEQGSYLQKFCLALSSAHGLTPKIAGWTSYITINTQEDEPEASTKLYGAKSRTKGTGLKKAIAPKKRAEEKFVYVCREGSVAKLELAEWSDKA